MDYQRWERLQELFGHASDLPSSERRAYLQSQCGDDDKLRAEIEEMLAEDALGRSLLDRGLPRIANPLAETPGASLPPDEFGPYHIKRILGEGGMGVVYLAEREDLGNLVAIKVLRDGLLSPSRQQRFTVEQRTLAQLEHPLIARIYDADTLPDGTPWFAMEYVEGLPIAAYCIERECSIAERVRLLRSVCEAVQYAHSHAIIHRDLKPSNILVKTDGQVKLLDFGIAKRMENGEPADRTRTELRAMTLAYAAPEQIRGEQIGVHTDVYALGVMLYEMLAGRLPFDLSNLSQGEAELVILQREPEPPSAVTKSKPRGKSAWSDLDVLTLTAMHKDVQRRYRSVEALIRDIDHYTNGEPLEARPDSVSYRLGKFIKRNRRVLSAMTAMFAIVLALVVFFVVRLARARTAAVAEARRTDRIERFMLNLFDGGDKTAGPADDLRVVTLLDRGVQTTNNLSTEPAVQAELYQTLGNIYQRLGKFDQADPLLRSSLERRKTLTGPDNPEVADSLVTLGQLRLDQGKVEDAERFVRQGLASAPVCEIVSAQTTVA